MKKHVVVAVATTLLLSAAGLARAEPRIVPADDSALSRLCVAAASSQSNLLEAARAAGLSARDLDSIRCNGLKLTWFAGKYRRYDKAEPAAYIFRKSDEDPTTQLCVAAASSDTELQKVKALYFANSPNIESEVACNGLPLPRFARKYRGA